MLIVPTCPPGSSSYPYGKTLVHNSAQFSFVSFSPGSHHSRFIAVLGLPTRPSAVHPVCLSVALAAFWPQTVAVGTPVARRPPHGSVREELPHTALAADSSVDAGHRLPIGPTEGSLPLLPSGPGGVHVSPSPTAPGLGVAHTVRSKFRLYPARCPEAAGRPIVLLGRRPSLPALRRQSPNCLCSGISSVLGRRRRACALASVRRSNCTYGFPVCSFHEDSSVPKCERRN